ncbi:MAG: porin PorA family protein [Corynebacterium sp.]|nr:porin PorA family protein [Corynebacterium sp.]
MPRPRVTALVGLILLILGTSAPGWFAERSRPLARDIDHTSTAHSDNAHVGDTTQPATLLRHVTTNKVDTTGAVGFHNTVTLTAGDNSFALSQEGLLNRESTYPMSGANTQQSASGTGMFSLGMFSHAKDAESSKVALGDFDGVTAFFPARTEQRSYPYFDLVAQETVPIDYRGEEKFRDIPAFVFYQERTGLQVASLLADAPLNYSFARTIWVEPVTGEILSQLENIELVDRAGQTVFSAQFEWDENSQIAAVDRVNATVRWVRISAVVGWVLAFVGVVLLLRTAVVYAKTRQF